MDPFGSDVMLLNADRTMTDGMGTAIGGGCDIGICIFVCSWLPSLATGALSSAECRNV